MDRAGLTCEQRDNCFVRVSDPARAQALLDEQLRTDWVRVLHAELGRPLGQNCYWTASQIEYATDLLFQDAARLAAFCPRFVHHGIKTFASGDVLRVETSLQLQVKWKAGRGTDSCSPPALRSWRPSREAIAAFRLV